MISGEVQVKPKFLAAGQFGQKAELDLKVFLPAEAGPEFGRAGPASDIPHQDRPQLEGGPGAHHLSQKPGVPFGRSHPFGRARLPGRPSPPDLQALPEEPGPALGPPADHDRGRPRLAQPFHGLFRAGDVAAADYGDG